MRDNKRKFNSIVRLFVVMAALFSILSLASTPVAAQDSDGGVAITIDNCGATKMTGKYKDATFEVVVPENCSAIVDTFGWNDCLDAGVVLGYTGPVSFTVHLTDGKVRTLPTDAAPAEFINTIRQLESLNQALSVAIPGEGWKLGDDELSAYGPYGDLDEFTEGCGAQTEMMYLSQDENCVYFCDLDGDGKLDAPSVPEPGDQIGVGGDNGGGDCRYFCPRVDDRVDTPIDDDPSDDGDDSGNGGERTESGIGKTIEFKAGDTVQGTDIDVFGVGADGGENWDYHQCRIVNAPADGRVNTGVIWPDDHELDDVPEC